jgi:hypothetical protein
LIALVFNEHDRVAGWVSEKIGAVIAPPYVAIGASKDGGKTLCGGAVFNDWNNYNIEITLASDDCLTQGTIRGIYHYLFEQSKAGRVTAHTRRSNKAMRDMLPRFGFEFESIAKRYYGPNKADDAFVFVLFPENARKFYG